MLAFSSDVDFETGSDVNIEAGSDVDFETASDVDFETGSDVDFEAASDVGFEAGSNVDFKAGSALGLAASFAIPKTSGMPDTLDVLEWRPGPAVRISPTGVTSLKLLTRPRSVLPLDCRDGDQVVCWEGLFL